MSDSSAGDLSFGKKSAFQSLQRGMETGDSNATQALFDQYARKLVALAGNHIHPALQKRFDGEDVVQSVFRTFFRRKALGDFQFEHSQQLWRLLITLTLFKTRSHARKHTADKRDARHDHPIDDELVLYRQPSPHDALAMWEEIDLVLEGLPSQAADILALRLEGRNKSEIASELSLSRQTIHRVISLLQDRLSGRFEDFSRESS